MRHFATKLDKSKGQFYTPREVSHVMAQLTDLDKANNVAQSIHPNPGLQVASPGGQAANPGRFRSRSDSRTMTSASCLPTILSRRQPEVR